MQNAPRGAFCNTFDLHLLPFSIKTFVLSIFKWPLKTGFTVAYVLMLYGPVNNFSVMSGYFLSGTSNKLRIKCPAHNTVPLERLKPATRQLQND